MVFRKGERRKKEKERTIFEEIVEIVNRFKYLEHWFSKGDM